MFFFFSFIFSSGSVLSLATAADIQKPWSCDEIAIGFQNPIDSSVGFAWPLPGTALPKEKQITISDTKGNSYRLIRSLKEDSSEVFASLALDQKGAAVVVKELRPKNDFRNFEEKLLLYAFLLDAGFAPPPTLNRFSIRKRQFLVQPYFAGMNAPDLLDAFENNSLELTFSKLQEIQQKLASLKTRIHEFENSDFFQNFAESNNMLTWTDTSPENFVYFEGEWFWVDP